MFEAGSEVRQTRGLCFICGRDCPVRDDGYTIDCAHCEQSWRAYDMYREPIRPEGEGGSPPRTIRPSSLSAGVYEEVAGKEEGGTDMKMTMYMVELQLGYGLHSYCGPFPSADEAMQWAKANVKHQFSILPLEAPWTETGTDDAQ